MREINLELHRQRVSASLVGKFGAKSRRWKGNKASYYAIHMWVVKHWGKANHCEQCGRLDASRYEWCNVDKKYERIRTDWIQLCPSCHRLSDFARVREEVYAKTN